MTVPAPSTVRLAAILVALEGAAALVTAVVLLVHGFGGGDRRVAFGTAAWFAIVGGGVFFAGWTLWGGRRWGRGLAVFANLLLLPVAWYMAVGSHQWVYGILVAVVALVTLALMFSPSALEWVRAQDPASADKPGPDTR